MPKIFNKTSQTVDAVENVAEEATVAETVTPTTVTPDIEALLKKIAELEAKMAEMEETTSDSVDLVSDEPVEPPANKNIKLMSLYYGTLNLATQPNGGGRIVSFNKYGQIRNVLYSTLIDIVNTNRRFSEEGYFYIMDSNAVYHLGLSEFYKDRVIPKSAIDGILDYDASEIPAIVGNLSEAQKDIVEHIILDKMNKGTADLNKVEVVGKALGCDFSAKLAEMKSFSK